MKIISPFTQGFEQLPDTLPIFPLQNAVVMPGSFLPLNIFEPRYLNMIQDAMQTHRLIGMIQPKDSSVNPMLYNVGCAARITRYEETLDGRIEIALTGLCRFTVQQEITNTRGYRLIKPVWNDFKIDYEDQHVSKDTLDAFFNSLKIYFNQSDYKLDWDAMKKLDAQTLFNSLYCFIKLSDEDQQMLLEIHGFDHRVKALTAVLVSNVAINKVRH